MIPNTVSKPSHYTGASIHCQKDSSGFSSQITRQLSKVRFAGRWKILTAKSSRSYIFIALLVFAAMGGVFGCATQKNQQNTLKEQSEYRRAMELQEQKTSKDIEDEISKKVPEMTAEGYEKSGDDYLRRDNIGMAFIQYDKALRLDPKQTGIRNKTGHLFLRRGLMEEAMREFEEVIKNDPLNAPAYEGKGMVFIARGNLDTAKECFRQAVHLDSKRWQAHTLLGIIHDRQGEFAVAINEYHNAIKINPNASILYNNLGMSYYLKGEYEKSVEALTAALKIEPANQIFYNNLGLALCRLNRYDEAFTAFKKGGDEAGAYNNIGCVYMKEQKYEEALHAFEKAIEIKPSYYVKAHENREMVKEAMEKQIR
ncbi:MAG: tetratricopeptide repeat protein [Candidatus Jettenia sp. CY-1]|nr:MAG: tetratricopeptide repeat protein [Candidatus Jettenia sp. CY-1]